ncbi:MAG: phage/plasmid primase, P4 family [Verrucomicrobiae bacterium]
MSNLKKWPQSAQSLFQNYPLPEAADLKTYFSSPALPYLVACLYGFPDEIEDFASHLENDPKNPGDDPEQTAAETIQVLVEYSEKLREAGENLTTWLTRKHGEDRLEKTDRDEESPQVIDVAPNPPYHAEFFALTRKVGFDQVKRSFYQYNPENGTWEEATPEQLRQEAAAYWKEFADFYSENPTLRTRILVRRTTSFLDSFIKQVATNSYFYPSYGSPLFLHAANKMVGIGSKEKNRDFAPAFFSLNRLPITYLEKAECPLFLKFLKGATSEDDVTLLQYWSGGLAMGANYFQKILLITGEGGSGKSVFALIIEGIIGQSNCIELRTGNLGDRFEQGRFLGKSLLMGLDVPMHFLSSPSAAHLKKLTGNDSITPEVKGSTRTTTIKGRFNVLITGNVTPRLRVESDREAWARRLLHVEFKKDASRTRMDRQFAEKLLKEEGPGILRWMVKGARQLKMLMNNKQDWKVSPEQTNRIVAILDEAESVRAFLGSEVIDTGDPQNNLTTEELYDAYNLFCNLKDWIPLVYGQFNRQLPSLMVELFQSKLRPDIKRRKQKRGKTHEGNKRGYARVKLKNQPEAELTELTPATKKLAGSKH